MSRAPALPVGWITALLMAGCVVYFLAMTLHGVDGLDPSAAQALAWGANFAPLTLTGDRWRLLSSVFMHLGLLHLLVNLYSLYVLGRFAEFCYGRLAFLLLFLLGGLAASLASVQANLPAALAMLAGETVYPQVAAGASGAIFALAGALLVNARWPEPSQTLRLRFRPLLVVVLLNLALGSLVSGIDHAAHLGGVLAGLVLGAVYAASGRRAGSSALLLRVAGLLAFLGLLILWLGGLEHQAAALHWLRPALLAEFAQSAPGFSGLH